MAGAIRRRLESIGVAAESSGVKSPSPDSAIPRLCRRSTWSRYRELWIAICICLPVLLFGVWRVHQHNRKAACVVAANRVGLTARLELQEFRGPLGFLNTPFFRYSFATERAIIELDNDKDLALLILSDVEAAAPVTLYTFFDLTTAQRNSIWTRFQPIGIVRLVR
jgi:hypothetical protein